MGLFDRRRDDDDPSLLAARADAEGALPAGWTLAVACDRPGAYVALARRLRGDLDETAAWSPPLHNVERH
jgi:hypothetical protein